MKPREAHIAVPPEFRERDYCHLYGNMWVSVKTHEKVLVIDDLAISLKGLIGKPFYLSTEEVDRLIEKEFEALKQQPLNNYKLCM
jgi:hypothetical protein